MSCEYIRAGEIDQYVDDNKAEIVDLRENEEYKQGHIRNAINVPYDDFLEELDHINGHIKKIDIKGNIIVKDKIYVLYCGRGTLSMMICNRLSYYGYNTKSVVGGIRQYKGNNIVMS